MGNRELGRVGLLLSSVEKWSSGCVRGWCGVGGRGEGIGSGRVGRTYAGWIF